MKTFIQLQSEVDELTEFRFIDKAQRKNANVTAESESLDKLKTMRPERKPGRSGRGDRSGASGACGTVPRAPCTRIREPEYRRDVRILFFCKGNHIEIAFQVV